MAEPSKKPDEIDTRVLPTVSSTDSEPARDVAAGPVRTRPRRSPDVLALVSGLISLGAAAMVLTGWAPDPRWLDLRWALAGAAVVLGLGLLAGTLRPSRERPPPPAPPQPAPPQDPPPAPPQPAPPQDPPS